MAEIETAAASHANIDKDASSGGKKKKNHNKYRREKPWDTGDIDKWNVPAWDDKDGENGDNLPGGRLLEESSFATLFPKYRETYLRHVWPVVTQALDKYHIACELNLVEGSMTVRTTSRTSDPYIILKARDLLKLLARSLPVAQAVQILQDEWICDVVKIGGIVRNTQRFVKRRQRLIGHDGATLKALELVTGCYILVQGHTVSIMSKSYNGLKQAREVVIDCMNNIHPIYHIKRLMIQKELAQDPKLANEDWGRFLPTFAKKNVPRKKPKTKKNTKKTYTPFPPAPTPRKVDLQLDTGEYFATQEQRDAQRVAKKQQAAAEKSAAKRAAREQEHVAPAPAAKRKKTEKVDASANIDVDRIKAKLAKTTSGKVATTSDFVQSKKKRKKDKK